MDNSQKTPIFSVLTALPSQYPGFWKIPEEVFYVAGCRKFSQFCQSLRALVDPEMFCMFCDPAKMKNPPIEFSGGWYVKESDYPYENEKWHFILIPKRHITTVDELTEEDAVDRFRLEKFLVQHFGLRGHNCVMRVGDPHYTVATVPHLHAHVQVPTGIGPVMSHFAKTPGRHEEDYEILKRFTRRVEEHGGIAWLMDPATVFPD